MRSVGSSLIATSLFVRDRIVQGASDVLAAHRGVGPFGIATGMLRIAAVLQAATMASRAIAGHMRWDSALDAVMAAVFCWVCVVWSNLTAAAARRPPKPGCATASALHRDDYLTLVLLIVAFLAWDLWDFIAGATSTDALTTASDFVQGLGFLLGSTLWRDPPPSGQPSPLSASAVP